MIEFRTFKNTTFYICILFNSIILLIYTKYLLQITMEANQQEQQNKKLFDVDRAAYTVKVNGHITIEIVQGRLE